MNTRHLGVIKTPRKDEFPKERLERERRRGLRSESWKTHLRGERKKRASKAGEGRVEEGRGSSRRGERAVGEEEKRERSHRPQRGEGFKNTAG